MLQTKQLRRQYRRKFKRVTNSEDDNARVDPMLSAKLSLHSSEAPNPMRAFIPFAIVILMSTFVAATAAAQTLPAPQAVTDPKQIAARPNAQVEPRTLTIEKLYMTRQVGRPTWS